jgi:predicted 3-demethylubiquinone-9 3-methyltransferase (glyoxalase superfamily)
MIKVGQLRLTNPEEAAKFYVSVFKNSRIRSVTRYGEAGPGPKGSVTKEAISEAVQLASQALLKHADEFVLEL